MKKFLAILLVFFINSTFVFAGVINEVCTGSGEVEYFPIGDERGMSVLTKKEVNRDCNLTIETQGACIKWEEKRVEYNIKPSDYNTYRSENHEGALGSIFAIMGAYNQLEHLWSGWKGYCESGTKTDFSWASDPMFWASLAMSTIMGSMQSADPNSLVTQATGVQGSSGFLADSTLATSYNSFTSSVGTGFSSLAAGVGMTVADSFGPCLVAAGVDMAQNLYGYFEGDDIEPCDPVDEFCSGQNAPPTQESDVMTIDQQQYDDLIAQHPEAAEQIIILDEENGILSVRFKQTSEVPGSEAMSQDELQKLQEQMKNMQMLVSTAMVAGKLASCMATNGSMGSTSSMENSSSSSGADASSFSVKDGIGMAINAIPAEFLGPYGALIKAALMIILEFATSFKSIDTCHDEEDADAAGTRHKKTYESLPYNLCKQTSKTCAQKAFLSDSCGLDAFHYCCYDQLLTRILVEQLKAQLGRDWAHCTGITLRDLNFVSFRQCTDYDKTFGVDGAKVVLRYNADGDLTNPYDPKTSYQYVRKCIDLGEFKEYLNTTFNQEVDMSDFDSIFSDMEANIGE